MGTLIQSYTDPQLPQYPDEQLDLSLILGKDCFSYLITDQARQVLAAKAWADPGVNYQDNLPGFFQTEAPLKRTYRQVRLGVVHPCFGVFPSGLFQGTDPSVLFSTICEHSHAEEVLQTDAPVDSDLRFLFLVNRHAADFFNRRFSSPLRMRHVAASILEFYQTQMQEFSGVCVHVWYHQVLVMVIHSGKLHFANMYAYQCPEDLLYFTMLAFQENQLDPESTPLQISGMIARDSEIHKILFRYVREVAFTDCGTLFGPRLEDRISQPYCFLDLLSLAVCG